MAAASRTEQNRSTALTIPSKDAPYPARPRLPIVQMAGHSPRMLLAPGNDTLVSMYPPVKQNLFHVDIMPRLDAFSRERFRARYGGTTLTSLVVEIVGLLL